MNVRLTPREREAFVLYTTGFTSVQVAHRMGVAHSTVVSHLNSVRDKYTAAGRDARTKLDLRSRAVEDGVIDHRASVNGPTNDGLLGSGAWSPVTSPTARRLRILYRPTGSLAVTS